MVTPGVFAQGRGLWKAAVSTAAFCVLSAGCSDERASDARSPEARQASRQMGSDFDRAARAAPNSDPLPVDPTQAKVDPRAEPVAVN